MKIVCKNCKNYKGLKIITPYDKKGYWLMCEECGYERKLPNNKKTRDMFSIGFIYTNCLTHRFTYGSLKLEDIKKYVFEAINKINSEPLDVRKR